jgi:hypothetical protein
VLVPDVNILLYAFRADLPQHARYRDWLLRTLDGDQAVGLPGAVVAGFVRVATHPRVFAPPTPPEEAVRYIDALRDAPIVVTPTLGATHIDTFLRLCAEVDAKGSLVADAYLAAIVIELDAQLVTTDRDFARFAGLRWRHPLR